MFKKARILVFMRYPALLLICPIEPFREIAEATSLRLKAPSYSWHSQKECPVKRSANKVCFVSRITTFLVAYIWDKRKKESRLLWNICEIFTKSSGFVKVQQWNSISFVSWGVRKQFIMFQIIHYYCYYYTVVIFYSLHSFRKAIDNVRKTYSKKKNHLCTHASICPCARAHTRKGLSTTQ